MNASVRRIVAVHRGGSHSGTHVGPTTMDGHDASDASVASDASLSLHTISKLAKSNHYYIIFTNHFQTIPNHFQTIFSIPINGTSLLLTFLILRNSI